MYKKGESENLGMLFQALHIKLSFDIQNVTLFLKPKIKEINIHND